MESLEGMAYWLPLIWLVVLGVAVALYVVLDGFDLGIGILFPASPEEAHRDQMMNSVAPFWDGNETWLVLGGGGLLVAFPMAYGILMPAVYLPVMFMLLALVFRGVAFEFRWVAKPASPDLGSRVRGRLDRRVVHARVSFSAPWSRGSRCGTARTQVAPLTGCRRSRC